MRKRMMFWATSIICICFLILIIPAGAEAATPMLSKKKITMTVGTKKQLEVKYTKKTIKWKSSSKKIAKVSQKGLVTAKKEGKTTITATIGKKILKCRVNVSTESVSIANRSGALISKKETHEMGMGDYLNVLHHEGSVSCWIADKSIANIYLVEKEKAEKNKLGKSIIYIYGLESGTTVIYVQNTKTGLIREVPIQIQEMEWNGKQTLARWLVKNGEFDEEGGMGIYEVKVADGKTYLTEIVFSAVSYEVFFGYAEMESEEVKAWTMTGHLHAMAVQTMMVDILVPDIHNPNLYHHVQRTIDGADCNLDHIDFWYAGYPTLSEWDSMQDTYRMFNKTALKAVQELMIVRTGYDWNALGQPCFVQEQSQ